MKRIIGIGLVTAALLAGCGSANQPNTDTGAATTTAGDTSSIPTSETGAGQAADTAPDATAALNETAVSDAGATAADATAMATPETSTGADATAMATPETSTGTSGDTTTGSTGADATTTLPTPDASTGTSGDTTGSTGSTGSTGAFQPVAIPELGLAFQVPQGWEQVAGENAWSPAGVDTPRVGVESADVTPDWKPSSFLPTGATVKSSQQLTVAGTQAMFYTVENTDGTAETHAILRSGTKAYDFYARAESLQELQTIQPVLSEIVGSVQMGGV